MPRNVEVKAKVHNKEQLVKLAKELCKEDGTIIEQDDTFFVTEKGRLKLRIFKVINCIFYITTHFISFLLTHNSSCFI